MSLSEARLGQIALFVLQGVLEEKGVNLNPAEIQEQVLRAAGRYKITPYESAEITKYVIKQAYEGCMEVLEKITPSDNDSNQVR